MTVEAGVRPTGIEFVARTPYLYEGVRAALEQADISQLRRYVASTRARLFEEYKGDPEMLKHVGPALRLMFLVPEIRQDLGQEELTPEELALNASILKQLVDSGLYYQSPRATEDESKRFYEIIGFNESLAKIRLTARKEGFRYDEVETQGPLFWVGGKGELAVAKALNAVTRVNLPDYSDGSIEIELDTKHKADMWVLVKGPGERTIVFISVKTRRDQILEVRRDTQTEVDHIKDRNLMIIEKMREQRARTFCCIRISIPSNNLRVPKLDSSVHPSERYEDAVARFSRLTNRQTADIIDGVLFYSRYPKKL